uniref:Uncharacterized protein n=1 Tax=Rhizophagus irregularis (strain DAOM 181602 / DAOM 197198 / MUCL 43194) TaxID=747089 RepID=U9SRS4_RHIID
MILLGGEHKLSTSYTKDIDVGINEIGLELMLEYFVSIESLDEQTPADISIETL